MNYQARTVPMITENLLGYVAEPYRTFPHPCIVLRFCLAPVADLRPPRFLRRPPSSPSSVRDFRFVFADKPSPKRGIGTKAWSSHPSHPTDQSPSSWKTRK